MPTNPDPVVPAAPTPATPAAPDSIQAGGNPAAPAAPVNAAGSGSISAPTLPDSIQAGGNPAAPAAPVNAAGSGSISAPAAPPAVVAQPAYVAPVAASLTIGGGNGGVILTAKNTGPAGNGISAGVTIPGSLFPFAITIDSEGYSIVPSVAGRMQTSGMSNPTDANRMLYHAGMLNGYASWTNDAAPVDDNRTPQGGRALLYWENGMWYYKSATADVVTCMRTLVSTAAYPDGLSLITGHTGLGTLVIAKLTSCAFQVAAAVNSHSLDYPGYELPFTAALTGTGTSELPFTMPTYFTGGAGLDAPAPVIP